MSSKNDKVFVDAMNTAFIEEKYKHNGHLNIRDLEFGEAEDIINKLVESLMKVSGTNGKQTLKSVISISRKFKSTDKGCEFFTKLLHRASEDKGKAEVVRRLTDLANDLIRGYHKATRLKMDNPKVLKLMLHDGVVKLFEEAGWTLNEDKGYRWIRVHNKDPKDVGEKMLNLIDSFKKSNYLGDLSAVRVFRMRTQPKRKSAKNTKSPKTTINRKKNSFKTTIDKKKSYKKRSQSIEQGLIRFIKSLSPEQINNLLKNRMTYNSPRSFGQKSNNRHNILIRGSIPSYPRRKSSTSNLTPRRISPRSSRRKSRSAPF